MIVFLFAVLFVSYCALSAQSQASFLLAARRSRFDRAVIEQARSFAADRSWQARCGISGYADLPVRNIEVDSIPVVLTDRGTLIEADYRYQQISQQLRLYYDPGGILQIEYR